MPLTYGAASAGDATATGQLSVAEMIDGYQLQCVGSQTQIQLHLCADSTVAAVTSDKSKGAGGDVLQVPLASLPKRRLRSSAPPGLSAPPDFIGRPGA